MFVWSLLSFCVIAALLNETETVTITVKNSCQYPLWPGILTGAGKPQLDNTGFELPEGGTQVVEVPFDWTAGRIWARTQCDSGPTCVTGDCGSGAGGCAGRGGAPPVTLAEFTLHGDGGQDFYDISNVDGFNVPLSIEPQGGSGDKCTITACSNNINSVCPPELAVRSGDDVVGCKSACAALNKPEYCCTGDYSTPETCPPTDYSRIFKDQCPQAYSYAYDDKSSTFICSGGPNYLVTFCP